MGLIADVSGVFEFLRSFFDTLPVAIRLLVSATFGGMIYIAVIRDFKG